MIRIETAASVLHTYKTEKGAINRLAREDFSDFDTDTQQVRAEIRSRWEGDASGRYVHDVVAVTYALINAADVPEGAQGQVSGARVSHLGKRIPYGYSARVVALHESGRLRLLNHTGTLVQREDEVLTLLPGSLDVAPAVDPRGTLQASLLENTAPAEVAPQLPLTVVTDPDLDFVQRTAQSLPEALRIVHGILAARPLADVVVLDRVGEVLYDVEHQDSCTVHLVCFSKNVACPRCADESDCATCGAESGEPCDPFCLGLASAEDDDAYAQEQAADAKTCAALRSLLHRDNTHAVLHGAGFLLPAERSALDSALFVLEG